MVGSTTDVGLDTSKKSIQVAMLVPGRREPVEWELANEPAAVKRLAKRLCARQSENCGFATRRARAATRCSDNFERRAWTRSWSLHR
jgi:hypothetical protein